MLEFNPDWRFQNPQDDEMHHGVIPPGAAEDFMQLIRAANAGTNRKAIFEHFGRRFAGLAQQGYWSSSTLAFAEDDCRNYLMQAAERAPLFIEGFYDAWLELQQSGQIRTPPIEGLSIESSRNMPSAIVSPLQTSKWSEHHRHWSK